MTDAQSSRTGPVALPRQRGPAGAAFEDTRDFADADRGFLRALTPGVVTDANGKLVWSSDAYAFLSEDCPDTAHPSLWRQSQLCARQGLYEVTEGVYQVRGFDLSNMTLVEGDTGVIVIDPLISVETAAAALELYRSERGPRPVSAVIYTHSHADHFGGVRGVLGDNPQGVPILAPEGFLEHAVSENVYAGPAMTRRAIYMYGPNLETGPAGQIGCGLGQTTSDGSVSLLRPTRDVTRTGQEDTLDGVRIVFQLTPGTEAPAEMNFLFPEQRALCLAENATHNMHNILTLRGAVVRDALSWSRYIDEAIEFFDGQYDVAFASHHWPTWGREQVRTYLSQQRDLYAYLHGQTLRLMNQGYTGLEIAELLDGQMPPDLQAAWHTHGYYGSVSHNVKAIYQSYMGWFDGHPASLWEHPPEESAVRYVETIGGVAATVAKAEEYAERGDLRFAAQLLKHAVFAEPESEDARLALARVFDQLAYGAENGTWRNFYLNGALELRTGIHATSIDVASLDLLGALTITQLLDTISIRVNGPRAWSVHLAIDLVITDGSGLPDADERHRLTLSNGALIHRRTDGSAGSGHSDGSAELTMTLTRPELLAMLGGQGPQGTHTGDLTALQRLLGLLDAPDPSFAIVAP